MPAGREVEDALLEGEDLGCRPPVVGQLDRLFGGEEVVGSGGDLVEGGALARGLGDGPDRVAPLEAGLLFGHGGGELVVADAQLGRARDPGDVGEVEAEVAGALAPLGAQVGFGDGLRVSARRVVRVAMRAPSPECRPSRSISATISARRREKARRMSPLMPTTSATPWRSISSKTSPRRVASSRRRVAWKMASAV